MLKSGSRFSRTDRRGLYWSTWRAACLAWLQGPLCQGLTLLNPTAAAPYLIALALLLLELPIEALQETLPAHKAQWIATGDSTVVLQRLRELAGGLWILDLERREPLCFRRLQQVRLPSGFTATRCHGNQGESLKSGSRFSRKALRPSCPSAVR